MQAHWRADTYIVADKARAAERGTKYQAIIWTKDREGNPVTILLTEGAAQDVAAYLGSFAGGGGILR